MAPASAQEVAEPAIAAARGGGTVIVCRHAMTRSMREVEPVDYDDPATQRLLSREGERQSAAMGRALRALDVAVAELVASPMRRAVRTAELMLEGPPVIDSIWHTNGGSYSGAARAARARVLSTPVPSGNRLIVSHIGTMSSVLPDARGKVDEGDCVVVRPDGSGEAFDAIGVVPWKAWLRAAETAPEHRPDRWPDDGGDRKERS